MLQSRESMGRQFPTVLFGQICEPFPEWDVGREIPEVSDKRVCLWSRGVWQGVLRPLS